MILQQQQRGGKICSPTFFSHKYHKIVNYFIFEQVKKKNLNQFIVPFTQKKLTKLSKICVWDPGSEIQDLGSWIRIQRSKGHRIPDPQNWLMSYSLIVLWCSHRYAAAPKSWDMSLVCRGVYRCCEVIKLLNIVFNRLTKSFPHLSFRNVWARGCLFSETYRLAFQGKPQITSTYLPQVCADGSWRGGGDDWMKV